jgi:hypothetical protein
MATKRSRQSKPKLPRSIPQVPNAPGDDESSKLGTGLDNEGFVIDLFLDRDRAVRLTQILHVKSNDGEAWDGWDERRLLKFFIDRAQLSIPAPEEEAAVFGDDLVDERSSSSEPLNQQEKSDSSLISLPAEIRQPVEKRIEQGIEIISSHPSPAGRMIERGKPFQIRLFLGDATAVVTDESELNYTVSVSAYKRREGSKYFIAQDQGRMKSFDEAIRLNIPAQNLEPGAYRLDAQIAIETSPQPEEEITPRLITSLNLQSRLLHVL